MKYGQWNIGSPDPAAVRELKRAGHHPILAAVLASRGVRDAKKAAAFLRTDVSGLHDPFLLNDMDKAVARFRKALERGEKIAVYGDYDVDGITSVCLLSRYLGEKGADFVTRIPDRTEEGYGLNEAALRDLRAQGVSLVITVDSGVTALELAELAYEIGLSLIITDHHHCRDTLPRAEAVINPYRRDTTYPFSELAGVGVAFKLVSAMESDQPGRLAMYSDLVALGTLADVMDVTGENRVMVRAGLRALETASNPGIRALLREAGVKGSLNASSVGFALAPRINAAGRVGRAEKAVELLMTDDPQQATLLARELCELNQLRQQLETSIINGAVEALGPTVRETPPASIVLCGEGWHQGVIGIVASRLAERYGCPVFLICVGAGVGKGSARSVRGIDLVDVLAGVSDLLDNFGGHAMAAGFSLKADRIGAFIKRVDALCASFPKAVPVLNVDAAVVPGLLDKSAAGALGALEPFGVGNPQPVLALENALLAEITPIGSGKHGRFSIEADGRRFTAVWFGMDVRELEFSCGDLADVAFRAEINSFRGEETLQLQIVDMRPPAVERESAGRERSIYGALRTGETLTDGQARHLLPTRAELGAIWRFLNRRAGQTLLLSPERLLRELRRETGHTIPLARVLSGLDVFSELELIELGAAEGNLIITPAEILEKRDLTESALYRRIKLCAEGGGSDE